MKGRFDHLKDFKRNASGEYEYTGATYAFTGNYKRFISFLVAAAVIACASAVVCGSLPAKGMLNTFYVMLPLLIEILFSALVAYKTLALAFQPYPIRQYAYKKAMPRTAYYAFVLAGASLIRLAAYIAFVIINAESEKIFQNELIFFILLVSLNVLVLITSIYIAISFVKSRWSLLESESEEKSDNK